MASKSSISQTRLNLNLNQGLLDRIKRIEELMKSVTESESTFSLDNIKELVTIYKQISNYLEYKYKKLTIFQKILGLIFGPPHQGAIEQFKDKLQPIVDAFQSINEIQQNIIRITNAIDSNLPEDIEATARELLTEEKDRAFNTITSIVYYSNTLLTSLNIPTPAVAIDQEVDDFIFNNEDNEGNNMLINFVNYLFSIEEQQQEDKQNKAFLEAIEKIVENSAVPMNLKLKVIRPLLQAVNSPDMSMDNRKRQIAEILNKHKIKIYTITYDGREGSPEIVETDALESKLNNWIQGLIMENLSDDTNFENIYTETIQKFLPPSPTPADAVAVAADTNSQNSSNRIRDLKYILLIYGLYKSKLETWDDSSASGAAAADDEKGVKHFIEDFHRKINSTEISIEEKHKAVRHLLYSVGSLRFPALHYAPYIVSLLKAGFQYNDDTQDYTKVKTILEARKNRLTLPPKPWKSTGQKRPREMEEEDVGKSTAASGEKSQPAAEKKGGKRKTRKRKRKRTKKGRSTKKKSKKRRK